MNCNAGPEDDVQKLMQRIRREVARQKAVLCGVELPADGVNDPVSDASGTRTEEKKTAFRLDIPDRVPFSIQPEFRPRADSRYHVDDLLGYYDAAFISCAYRALLLRAPDKGGYANYLKLLRSGCSKIDILGRLRYSGEGRAAGVYVSGLLFPYLLEQLYRIPVLGRFIQILSAVWRLPHLERTQRVIENRSLRLMEQAQSHWTESFRSLNPSFQRLEKAVERLQNSRKVRDENVPGG